jgi:uncharacterized protein (TIGR02118 family)
MWTFPATFDQLGLPGSVLWTTPPNELHAAIRLSANAVMTGDAKECGGEIDVLCNGSLSTQGGGSLDFAHYAGMLAPMYARFLGDNCIKFEVRKGLVTPGRSAPHFICMASYWVKSREEYGVSLAGPRMKDIMAQFSAFTDIEPIRQFDEVVA